MTMSCENDGLATARGIKNGPMFGLTLGLAFLLALYAVSAVANWMWM